MNDRMLGAIAMICAPALLIELLLMRSLENALISGIAGMVFMFGWICANTVMRRMRAAGAGKWGRAVLLIQLVGLVMAFMFGFFEATGLLGWDSIIFNVTDRAWPLSLLWMLVVGVTVLVAKRLRGWRRFVPLLCGLALPPGVIADIAVGDPGFVFCGLAALSWCLLGYVVRGGSQQVGLASEPAVQ